MIVAVESVEQGIGEGGHGMGIGKDTGVTGLAS